MTSERSRRWRERHREEIRERQRQRRANRPRKTLRGPWAGLTLEERFWARVEKSDGCWEWNSSKNGDGYGEFYVPTRRRIRSHRFSWQLHFGPIPDGLEVCHHCDNRSCVRPGHLFLGTQTDNAKDMWAKGRAVIDVERFLATERVRGATHPQAKLTEDAVRVIRADPSTPHTELARRFGVSPAAIRFVRERRTWAHVA